MGKPVLGVFLDIQAAFDTIKPEKIRDELTAKGVENIITNWYYNYLTHRNVVTTHNGISSEGTINIGFPQGGVCSAKFWVIAFNEAINIINQYGIHGTGFADDCSLLLHKPNIQIAKDLIQRACNELTVWGPVSYTHLTLPTIYSV